MDFRKIYSLICTILDLPNYIFNAMGESKIHVGTFHDFAKVFGTVGH